MKDPRLKLLYLGLVGVAALATANPKALLALLGLQGIVWVVARLPAAMFLDAVRRLGVFIVFVLISYAFFSGEEGDHIHHLVVLGLALPVNVTGIVAGLLMSTRIVTLVLASAVIRHTGDPGDLVRGLRMLHVPLLVGAGLDLVLASLGPQQGGRGRRGRGREDGQGSPRLALKRMLRGDASVLVEAVERSIARTRERAATYPVPRAVANDLAVLGGLAVLGTTLRLLKIFPGLPVAPGHKGVVLIPFYIVANQLTASRWGATQFGGIMGLSSTFLGMSNKLGPFGILRHIVPGLFVDLVVPPLLAVVRTPAVWLWGVVGAGAALTRLSTVVAAALVVEAPPAFYVMLVPMIVTNLVFGFLSGFVTAQLLGVASRLRASPVAEPSASGRISEEAESAGAARKEAP